VSPPGVQHFYANTNYVVAGLVVESVTGTSLELQVQKRLIEPLRLRATTFPTLGGPMATPYAHGYVFAEGQLFDATTPYPHWPSWLWASGNMVSNASDLATFYQALLGGQLLPADLLTAMKTPAPGSNYGLGLAAQATPCGTVWGHVGGIPGYRSVAGASEDGTRAMVMLVNVTPVPQPAEEALTTALVAAACAALGREPVPASPPTAGTSGETTERVLAGRW
jgi:D-alanyl-D-alanine carboxypeptidase